MDSFDRACPPSAPPVSIARPRGSRWVSTGGVLVVPPGSDLSRWSVQQQPLPHPVPCPPLPRRVCRPRDRLVRGGMSRDGWAVQPPDIHSRAGCNRSPGPIPEGAPDRGTHWRMEESAMIRRSGPVRRSCTKLLVALALSLLITMLRPFPATAQDAAQTGTISGKVVDAQGASIADARVEVAGLAIATQARANGQYT